MGSKREGWILLLFSFLTLSSIINSSHAKGEIAVYWGQNIGEESLTATCDTGNYDIVNLGFFSSFGCLRPPFWDFANHCGFIGPRPCDVLEPEILHCQKQGVKVFISIGGPGAAFDLCWREEARGVANYLYNNFLRGQRGPLGRVALDGIDFHIKTGRSLYWDELARELDALRRQHGYFYLSATPGCPIPDAHLNVAIRTGLFDNIYVQFYDNPSCQHADGNNTLLFDSWKAWTLNTPPSSSVFMGLPAAPDAAPSGGYIPPQVMVSEVLPYIQQYPSYGGVMLWDSFRDIRTGYSNQIRHAVPVTVRLLQSATAVSDAI